MPIYNAIIISSRKRSDQNVYDANEILHYSSFFRAKPFSTLRIGVLVLYNNIILCSLSLLNDIKLSEFFFQSHLPLQNRRYTSSRTSIISFMVYSFDFYVTCTHYYIYASLGVRTNKIMYAITKYQDTLWWKAKHVSMFNLWIAYFFFIYTNCLEQIKIVKLLINLYHCLTQSYISLQYSNYFLLKNCQCSNDKCYKQFIRLGIYWSYGNNK